MKSKSSKKTMILLAVIVVAVIIVIIAAVCNSNGSNDKPVNGDAAGTAQESADDIDLYMGVGQIYSYPVSEGEKMKFKSYDKDIVTVDENGAITALAMGTVKLKAGKDKINIDVIEAPQSIILNESTFSMGIGETFNLTATVPDSKYNAGFLFEITSGNAVTVDQSGKITAVSAGKSEITVSTYNGCTARCSVSVGNPPSSVSFSSTEKNIFLGTKFKLDVVFPEGCASMANQIKSDNEKVCTVDKDGLVSALTEGTANITITTFNGKSAACKITVTEKPYYIRTGLDPNKPMIALTFDDGPNASSTNRILQTLEDNNGSATFFIVGNRSKSTANSEAVKRMVEKGFQLGNHTYDHEHYGKQVTVEDITKCNDILHEVSGQYPSAFRPTGGYLSDTIKQNSCGPIILWSVDTLDWKSRNADSVYTNILKASDGDIVLMHDIYGSTADAVERAVPELVKNGYQIVNVAELAYYKDKTLEKGTTYYSVH